ncbi:MAG: ketopantoate reductase family protein [Planctomycetota bacterium]
MRVLIQGPGAIGRLLTARLALAEIEVGLLDHDPKRAKQLRREGISLMQESREHRASVKVLCGGTAVSKSNGPRHGSATHGMMEADLLVVCVKAYDVARAIPSGVRYLRKEGLLLVLSNGLGNLETAQLHWPRGQCLGGTITYGALREGMTGVRCTGDGRIRIGADVKETGEAFSGGERSAEVAQLFQSAGLHTEVVEDIQQVIWEKVAINCAINPVAALLGVENGQLPKSAAFPVAEHAAEEAAAVSVAAGVGLPVDGWGAHIEEVCETTPHNRCSMLVDLENRRRTEIDELNGRVAVWGGRLGVATPVNLTLTRLVKAVESLSPLAPRREEA